MINGEVTLQSTLRDCLQIKRQELAICSKNYNGLEPARGLEDAWQIQRKEVDILQEHIHALDSEKVRKVLAEWQQDVMQNGPRALEVELEPDERDTLALHRKEFMCPGCGQKIITYMENTNREEKLYEIRY